MEKGGASAWDWSESGGFRLSFPISGIRSVGFGALFAAAAVVVGAAGAVSQIRQVFRLLIPRAVIGDILGHASATLGAAARVVFVARVGAVSR